jgi:hypothetical protein
VLCMDEEMVGDPHKISFRPRPELPGLSGLLYRHAARRANWEAEPLPDLPVPEQFRQLFRDWAEGRVNFVEFPEG